MAKKWPGEWPQPYEFSQTYRKKKARIQEMGHSDLIEFLNWIENVNKWEMKEEWKKIVDQIFTKYSDNDIISLFNRFKSFKGGKPKWYKYEKTLNEAKEPLRTEIYGENIVKRLFGWYGNYLKLIKSNRLKVEAEAMEEVMQERIAETLQEWAENHYWGKDRDVEIGWEVVFNPEYEHVPVENSEILEDERNLPSKIEELNEEKLWEKKNEWWEEKVEEKKQRKEPEQLYIPFDYED